MSTTIDSGTHVSSSAAGLATIRTAPPAQLDAVEQVIAAFAALAATDTTAASAALDRMGAALFEAQVVAVPGPCTPGDQHEWVLTELGYERTWRTRVNDEAATITAYYSGTEDWTDQGDGNDHLHCGHCQQRRSIDGFEVDFR